MRYSLESRQRRGNIWQYGFLEIAQMLSGENKKTLKADVWNEIHGSPVKGGIAGNIRGEIFQIEWYEQRVRQAIRMGFSNIVYGDCRCLPFKNKFFDVILDFMTIGRGYEEYDLTLSEYDRVLREGGLIGVVYWTAEKLVKELYDPRTIKQAYFAREKFEEALQKSFSTTRLWDFDDEEKDSGLIVRAFIGKKT